MARSIAHFIWGYQHYFATLAETRAKRLFEHLDDQLEPEVFVVGINEVPRPDRYPACVEPESNFWIASEALNDVQTRARQIARTCEESQFFNSNPLAQERQDERLHRRAVRDAILEVTAACHDKPAMLEYHCSTPVPVGGFLVSTVLGLPRNVVERHPQLRTDGRDLERYEHVRLPQSLTHACAIAGGLTGTRSA